MIQQTTPGDRTSRSHRKTQVRLGALMTPESYIMSRRMEPHVCRWTVLLRGQVLRTFERNRALEDDKAPLLWSPFLITEPRDLIPLAVRRSGLFLLNPQSQLIGNYNVRTPLSADAWRA